MSDDQKKDRFNKRQPGGGKAGTPGAGCRYCEEEACTCASDIQKLEKMKSDPNSDMFEGANQSSSEEEDDTEDDSQSDDSGEDSDSDDDDNNEDDDDDSSSSSKKKKKKNGKSSGKKKNKKPNLQKLLDEVKQSAADSNNVTLKQWDGLKNFILGHDQASYEECVREALQKDDLRRLQRLAHPKNKKYKKKSATAMQVADAYQRLKEAASAQKAASRLYEAKAEAERKAAQVNNIHARQLRERHLNDSTGKRSKHVLKTAMTVVRFANTIEPTGIAPTPTPATLGNKRITTLSESKYTGSTRSKSKDKSKGKKSSRHAGIFDNAGREDIKVHAKGPAGELDIDLPRGDLQDILKAALPLLQAQQQAAAAAAAKSSTAPSPFGGMPLTGVPAQGMKAGATPAVPTSGAVGADGSQAVTLKDLSSILSMLVAQSNANTTNIGDKLIATQTEAIGGLMKEINAIKAKEQNRCC